MKEGEKRKTGRKKEEKIRIGEKSGKRDIDKERQYKSRPIYHSYRYCRLSLI
jgi:hypothetical protein